MVTLINPKDENLEKAKQRVWPSVKQFLLDFPEGASYADVEKYVCSMIDMVKTETERADWYITRMVLKLLINEGTLVTEVQNASLLKAAIKKEVEQVLAEIQEAKDAEA